MSLELTSVTLARLTALLTESLRASGIEYGRLMAVLQRKDPSVTDERIHEVAQQWIRSGVRPDRKPTEMGLLAGAYYEIARGAAQLCLQALTAGKATEQTVINAHTNDAALWRAIAMAAVALNGGPVAQSYFDDALAQLHEQDRKLQDIQTAYDELVAQSDRDGTGGKAPSQRAVTERSGYPRETVRSRWPFLKKR